MGTGRGKARTPPPKDDEFIMTDAPNDDRTRSTQSNRTEGEARIVEDGGIEQATTRDEQAQRSAHDWLQSFKQNRREQFGSLDRLQLLLACLFAIGVLGTVAGMTTAVPSAVLAPLGVGLLFLTYLLLAVILLRQLTADREPSSHSWSEQNRDPIKRRP